MRITRIQQQRRNKARLNIHIDGEFAFSVSAETAAKLHLSEGMAITAEEHTFVLDEEEKRQAMDAAWRLLGIRDRSTKELADALKRKEYAPTAITHTIQRLQDLGYLNDQKFAQSLKTSLEQRGYGPLRITADLRRKGIDTETIAAVIKKSAHPEEDEDSAIVSLAKRKLKTLKGQPPLTAAHRLTSFLARRGFTPDNVRTVIRSLLKEAPDEE